MHAHTQPPTHARTLKALTFKSGLRNVGVLSFQVINKFSFYTLIMICIVTVCMIKHYST